MLRENVSRIVASVVFVLVAAAPGRAQQGRVDAHPPPPPTDTVTLQEALSVALSRQPDIRRARADASAEHAARWADWGAFLPTADVSATFRRSTFTNFSFALPEGTAEVRDEPVTGERFGAGQTLGLQWSLLEGGRRFTELAAGGEEARAADLRLSAVERETAARVKEAYFEAVEQVRLVEIARRQLRNRRQELERARRRFRIAAIDRSELLGAEGQVHDAEIQLLDARDAVQRARRNLAVQMGTPERLGRRVALAEPPPPPPAAVLEADSVVARALSSHPELEALDARISAASARVLGERFSYLPTVSLGFNASRSESLGPEGNFFNFDPRNSSEGLSLTARWELFTGFGRKERNARQSADVDRQRAERTRRRLEIEKAVRDLTSEMHRRDRRLELRKRRLEVARERLRLTEEQFRVGSARYVELQQAIQELNTAERAVVQERHEYMKTWARLERWVGDLRGRG